MPQQNGEWVDQYSGGSKGGAPGACPPYGPKFSQFHTVFRKIWQNRMLAPPPPRGLVPPPGESWIRPRSKAVRLTQDLRLTHIEQKRKREFQRNKRQISKEIFTFVFVQCERSLKECSHTKKFIPRFPLISVRYSV